jgi:hypothetical protein
VRWAGPQKSRVTLVSGVLGGQAYLLLLQRCAAAEKFALFMAVSYVFMYTGWLLLSLPKKG